MIRIIGIGEYAISNDQQDIIKTFALGSCVALTIYSPVKKVLGMVHIALPSSKNNVRGAVTGLGHYADTAVPFMLDTICRKYGCFKDELILGMFGGAQSVQKNDVFNIGCRNVAAINKILQAENLNCKIREIGGSYSRTVEIDVATGTAKIDLHPIKI